MTDLPTEDEIGSLPRWAIVAYAARCARMVLPVYLSEFDDPSVENAVVVAEKCAAKARAVHASCKIGERYDEDTPAFIGQEAERAARDAYSRQAHAEAALAACVAAFVAATAADEVFHADAGGSAYADDLADEAADLAAQTAAHASAALVLEGLSWSDPQLKCFGRDFLLLHEMAARENWDESTPVPPTVFSLS